MSQESESRYTPSVLPLAQGTRLGPHEIVSAIGAGGMGEVYRARDTKLNRDVALKILPEAFTADADRLARFTREAQVLASLNHPNIAGIYGFEDSGATHALVMELVEGEDLAQRITRGAISIDEALPIAKQIADALEAAHEQGIIHRDLKPQNIKVRTDGMVKVLDFGLAKAAAPAGASGTTTVASSPTMTSPAMTAMGMILGTAAYMSPEQARGKPVDKRADIWAFGVVLYEMLTRRRLFAGEDISDVLAAVLRQDIDLSSLPSDTPPRLRRLLERCLDRDVKTRLRDMGEARVELARIASGAPDHATMVPASTSATLGRGRERLAWTVAAAALISVAALLVIVMRPSSPAVAARPLVRLPFVTPADASLTEVTSVIVSPDGRRLLFSARSPDGRRRLWLRPLDSMDVTPLPDTDDAIEPFWSPDSASIAFGAHGKLKRLDPGDARAHAIADAPRSNNGTWNQDGIIVFSPDYRSPLFRVKATGADRTNATPGPGDHRYPQFLPDGRHFLFHAGGSSGGISIGSLDAPETNKPVLQDSSGGAIYAAPGFLLYIRNGTLVAQPFDTDRLEATGQPTPIAPASANDPWAVQRLSASNTGVLVVQRPLQYDSQLAWFDRAGTPAGLLGQARRVNVGEMPRVSPDGRHVAVQRGEMKDVVAGRDIWIGDLARGTFDRLTTGEPFQQMPVWSSDGRYIICSINGIYAVPVAGGEKTRLLAGTVFPADVSPDGKWLFYTQRGETTRNDIWSLPLANGKAAGEPHVIINSPYEDVEPRVSPNGRWLAYTSDQSGVNEIYVRSLSPDGRVGDATRVSNSGGLRPVWARDGRELYYLAPVTGDLRMQFMALPVRTGGATFEFDSAVPRMRISVPNPTYLTSGTDYDVTPDGHILVGAATPDSRTPPATIILNWAQALKK